MEEPCEMNLDEEDDDDPARHRDPVPAQPPPGDLAQRPALDGHTGRRDSGFVRWRWSAVTRYGFKRNGHVLLYLPIY